MAEKLELPSNLISEPFNDECGINSSSPECPVCLQTCVHPVSLPCNHIFCFLCAKGLTSHSKKCAMCRKKIPDNYILSPTLVQDSNPMPAIDGKYQWFYRGTNGWWQYDPRASNEIESAFNNGDKTIKIMIAGFLYIVDIENMVQYRENIPSRSRHIKRDLVDIPDKKGVAGLSIARIKNSIDVSSVDANSNANNSGVVTTNVINSTSQGVAPPNDLNNVKASLNGNIIKTLQNNLVHPNDKPSEDRGVGVVTSTTPAQKVPKPVSSSSPSKQKYKMKPQSNLSNHPTQPSLETSSLPSSSTSSPQKQSHFSFHNTYFTSQFPRSSASLRLLPPFSSETSASSKSSTKLLPSASSPVCPMPQLINRITSLQLSSPFSLDPHIPAPSPNNFTSSEATASATSLTNVVPSAQTPPAHTTHHFNQHHPETCPQHPEHHSNQ